MSEMKFRFFIGLSIVLCVMSQVIAFKVSPADRAMVAYGGGRSKGSYRSSSSSSHMRSRSRSSHGGGGGGYVFIPDQPSMTGMSMSPKTLFLGLKVIILKVILLLMMKKGGGSDLFSGLMGMMDPSILAAMMPGVTTNMG